MEIKILVHLSLGVDQHVTNELLDPSHHYLRLDFKEFVLLLHFVYVLLVALFHFFVLFLDCVEERFCVIFDLKNFFFFKDQVVSQALAVRELRSVIRIDAALVHRRTKVICSSLTYSLFLFDV